MHRKNLHVLARLLMNRDNSMRSLSSPTTPTDSKQAAKAAGLRYSSDQKEGFSRRRYGKGFRYFDTQGHALTEKEHLARIKTLRIPPAWTQVWISPDARSHLQASGRDAKNRKQYLYHERWSSLRNETKFERMAVFAETLPVIRKQVQAHLALPGLPREKVLATLVKLLETTSIRIGNEEYAKTNKSFGLTTLRNRHVYVEKSTLQFRFRGKSGIFHEISLSDRKLARIVKQCQDLPGQDLFQYLDEQKVLHKIDSSDVNQYLHEIAGNDFTAKDFRTWSGTLCAVRLLQEQALQEPAKPSKKGWVALVKQVAARLGNTPSVCRKYYIHPMVLHHYEKETFPWSTDGEQPEISLESLEPHEYTVLRMLKRSAT